MRQAKPASAARIIAIGPADLARVAVLHGACFPDDHWDRDALAEVMAMPGASGRMAIAHGDAQRVPQGFLFDLAVGAEGEILTIGVDPALRHRGIARALLEDLFARARRRRVLRLVLEVAEDNDGARRLYEAMGFRVAGRRPGYYRRSSGVNVDAWLLERRLTLWGFGKPPTL
jgi:ribosomal-protein-alanine N-acetyltransferase